MEFAPDRHAFGQVELTVEMGDILTAEADAVVCPIDQELSVHLGVAEVLRDAEGPTLSNRFKAATQGFNAKLGSAFRVDSTAIKAKWIFFAVVCDLTWKDFKEDTLRDAVRSTLAQAQRAGLRSIAFSALGHPSLKPPYPFLADVMLSCLTQHLRSCGPDDPLRSVRFVLRNEEALRVFSQRSRAAHLRFAQEKAKSPAAPSRPAGPSTPAEIEIVHDRPSSPKAPAGDSAPAKPAPSRDEQDLHGRILDLDSLAAKIPKPAPKAEAAPIGVEARIAAIALPESLLYKMAAGTEIPGVQLTWLPGLQKGREWLRANTAEMVLLDHSCLYLGEDLSVFQEFRQTIDPILGTILMADGFLFDTLLEAVANSVDAFLPKPPTPASFRLAVRTALDKRALRAAQAKLLSDLDSLNKMQERFLHMVSHDLRSPLSVVGGAAEILLADAEIAAKPSNARMLKVMSSSLAQMQTLIGDLTDLAAMQTGKLKIAAAAANPGALLERASGAFELLAQKKGVGFERDFPASLPETQLDVDRVHQVLMNLLGNSLKHTPAGQKIRLHGSAEPGWIVFRVADTGAGIEPKELPRIFEPFFQSATAAANKKDGLGLGLAICSGIIHSHGGSIKASSEGLGKGTTIELRFPIAAAPPPSKT